MREIRKRKVESLLHETIGTILISGELKDPRLGQLVTVTSVSAAKDLRAARVFISVLGSDKARDRAVTVLNHAAGFIQKLIGPRLNLRYTPKLTFEYDDSLEKGFGINQTLKDIIT